MFKKLLTALAFSAALLLPSAAFAQIATHGGGTGLVDIASGAIPFGSVFNIRLGTSTNFTFNNAASRLSVTYASTTAVSATTFCLTGDICRTTWPTSGGGGGTGNLATSTGETAGQLAYWTSTNATPATLGKVATSTPTATAPITYSGTLGSFVGGAAGTFGCTLASAGVTGCLSGSDWSTFNNKQPAIALGAGTINSSSGNVLYATATSTPGITGPITYSGTLGQFIAGVSGNFGCTTASAGVAGCLNSSDWSTFNGKENVLTFSAPLIRTANNIAWTGLATTTQPSSSNLLTSNGNTGVYGTATSTLSASSPLTGSFVQVGSGGSLGCTTASAGVAGCLNSSDWSTFNNKQATIAATWPVILTGATLSFGGLSTSSAISVGQNLYATGVNTVAGEATGTLSGTANQIAISATAYTLLNGATLSLPSHVIFPNDFLAVLSSTTNATTTGSAYFTGITASRPLYVDSTGKLTSAGTGTSGNCVNWQANNTFGDAGSACGSGSGVGNWFTPTNNFGVNTNATSTIVSLLAGLNASSTVNFGNAGQSAFTWNSSTGRLGIGTSSPTEAITTAVASGGFATNAFYSGNTEGYFFAYDGTPEVSLGSKTNAQLNFKVNNSTQGNFDTNGNLNLQSNTGDNHTFVTMDAPAANPQESTFTERLANNGNTTNDQFIDWTLENYGTDNQGSINISKSGASSTVPFSIRFWNSDLGNIAANGVYAQTWLPNGTIGFGVSTSTAGATAGGANTFLYGASSTAATLFKLDAAAGTTRFQVTSAGIASTTNLNISGVPGCSGTNALTTSASGVVVCGAITASGGTYPFTPSTFGINVSATTTPILDYAGLITATSTIGALTASSSITNQGVKSALVLNSSTGLEGAYTGSSGTCTNQIPTSLSATGVLGGCTSITNAMLSNSTISGVALGGTLAALTATNSTLTFSGSYDGTTARTVGLNLGNANTWTAQQTFNTTAPIFGTMTSGSVLFAGTSGLLSQNNQKLFWNDAANSLLVGTSTGFISSIMAASSTAPQLTLGNATAGTGLFSFRVENDGGLHIATSTFTATSSNDSFVIVPTAGENTARVGIGTNAPAEILHLSKPAGNFTTMRFDSGATQGYFFAYSGTPEVSLGSNSNALVNFKVNNSTKMTINTTGVVAQIGTVVTHSFGVGAGTSPSLISLVGNGNDFTYNMKTGTTPTGSNAIIDTFTMATACPTATVPVWSDANSNTDALAVVSVVYASSTSASTFNLVSGATALAGSTNYIWNFHVGCY